MTLPSHVDPARVDLIAIDALGVMIELVQRSLVAVRTSFLPETEFDDR